VFHGAAAVLLSFEQSAIVCCTVSKLHANALDERLCNTVLSHSLALLHVKGLPL